MYFCINSVNQTYYWIDGSWIDGPDMIEGRKWHACDSFTNTDGDTILVVTDGQFRPEGPNVEILNLCDEYPTWMEGFEILLA